MADCIDCGIILNGKPGHTICQPCVDKRVAQLTPTQLMAMAKVGADAVIDEVTGYEKIRPRDDLKSRYQQYLHGER